MSFWSNFFIELFFSSSKSYLKVILMGLFLHVGLFIHFSPVESHIINWTEEEFWGKGFESNFKIKRGGVKLSEIIWIHSSSISIIDTLSLLSVWDVSILLESIFKIWK